MNAFEKEVGSYSFKESLFDTVVSASRKLSGFCGSVGCICLLDTVTDDLSMKV